MKSTRIMYLPPMSWKTRFFLFIGVFGIFWTFTESMLAFDIGTSLVKKFGIRGYSLLLFVSAVVNILVEYFNKYRIIQKITFTQLKIVLVQDGTVNLIEVPDEMLIREFIRLFILEISKQGSHPMIEKWDLFETTLQVEKPANSRKFKSLSKHKTIKQVGLQNGDVCRLVGIIEEPRIVFSR